MPSRVAGRARDSWSLVAVAVAVMAVRWWAALDGRFPRVVADETAYLAMARFLAGGETWDLGLASTYGPGYALLLVPWFVLDLDPDSIYRAAIGTNVLLAGLMAVGLSSLARRIPGVTRPLAAALAGVATLLPALSATTNLAWSDNLAPLVFVGLLLATDRLIRAPSTLSVALASGAVVGGYLVHGRFLLLAPVLIAVFGALALARRLRPWLAGAGTAGVVAGLVAVQVLQEALYARLYDPQQVTQGLNEADRITKVGPLLTSAAGQAWYLLVTTAGVAGVGAIALGWATARALRRSWSGWPAEEGPGLGAAGAGADDHSEPDEGPWSTRLRRLTAAVTDDVQPLMVMAFSAMTGAAFVTSVVFMTDRPRGDHLVYGRYNDLFVAPLVVIGLAALSSLWTRSRAATAVGATGAITAGLAVIVWGSGRDALEAGYLVYPVLGLVAIDPLGPAQLPDITMVALGLTALVGFASVLPGRARAIGVVMLTAALCLAGTVRAVDRIDPALHTDIRGVVYLDEVLEPGIRVGWVADDADHLIHSEFYRYQLYMPHNPSVRLVQEPWTTGEIYLIGGARLDGPRDAGYRLAWVDPGSSLGLWVAPGPQQDRLAADDRLLRVDGFSPAPGGDEGTVGFLDEPRIEGKRLRARLRVTRPAGEPWPTVSPGGDPLGRIRVGVIAVGSDCDCQLIDGRADFERWVTAEATALDLTVDLRVGVEALDDDLVLQVQLLREGTARFGTGDEAPVA